MKNRNNESRCLPSCDHLRSFVDLVNAWHFNSLNEWAKYRYKEAKNKIRIKERLSRCSQWLSGRLDFQCSFQRKGSQKVAHQILMLSVIAIPQVVKYNGVWIVFACQIYLLQGSMPIAWFFQAPSFHLIQGH